MSYCLTQKYEHSIRERKYPPFGCTIYICVKRAIPLTSRTLKAKKRDRMEERPGKAKIKGYSKQGLYIAMPMR